jgi:hypothetical protein
VIFSPSGFASGERNAHSISAEHLCGNGTGSDQSLTLSPLVTLILAFAKETEAVKILLSVAALVGSLSLLLSDWAGHAFPYL